MTVTETDVSRHTLSGHFFLSHTHSLRALPHSAGAGVWGVVEQHHGDALALLEVGQGPRSFQAGRQFRQQCQPDVGA